MSINLLPARLQAFRTEAARLLLEVDNAHGPGTPGVISDYYQTWAKALIALQVAAPDHTPTPSIGMTTYG